MFNSAETAACLHLVGLALNEDWGTYGDLTTEAIIPSEAEGRAVFVARFPGILAGLPAVTTMLEPFQAAKNIQPLLLDGSRLQVGSKIAIWSGPLHAILGFERTALNFLQHLSGVATLTRQYVDAVAGLECRILDTRKTTPGWRLLEKYAVRQGGGHNHRMGLYDQILIKDNHLAALRGAADPIAAAIEKVRNRAGTAASVEIEVDNLDQFDRALACTPEIILLDNMNLEEMREAVRRRNAKHPRILLEASGGITLANVRAAAETGVDRISIGALTHSAPALDISLEYDNSSDP
jgi:nicotinate-nucleotide pyrophosphorylase (carboxylating)